MSVHRTYRAWSAEDDAALQELLAAGVGKSAIARRLGRPTSSIRSRLVTLSKHQPTRVKPSAPAPKKPAPVVVAAPIPTAGMKRRRCMCCGTEFNSAGPHNRLCGRCRAKSAEISPYTPHL